MRSTSKGAENDRETPATVLLDEYYERIGLNEGWSRDRVLRLAAMLQVTPWELGKLFCISFPRMSRYLTAAKFPPPVALHFAMLESWYVSQILGVAQKPVLPVHILA